MQIKAGYFRAPAAPVASWMERLEPRRLLSAGGSEGAYLSDLPQLAPDQFAGGQSSYDRTGGNGDLGNFLRVQSDGESVLLDQTGPGVVQRMWFTNVPADARIRMYFDGETTPRLDETITSMIDGSDPRFVAPLVQTPSGSSGGWVSYVSLPYQRSLRITVSNAGALYYNMLYQSLPGDSSVTSWSGLTDSSAQQDAWNRASADPKETAGNAVQSGTIDIPANSAADLLDLAGSREIESIKLQIPGVAATMLPHQQVTDDGRAHRGTSAFTLSLPSGAGAISLVRRLDYGIADQKANVYVDGTLAGQWFDAGSDNGDHWRDSTFALPMALTGGKNSIRIKIEFVSSSVDWNEFLYTAYADGAAVDSVDVGNTASEAAHNYSITNQTWAGTRTFTYPAAAEESPQTDTGRAHQGSSSFDLAIDPANRGVTLVRQLDFGVADQKAGVYIDGTYAGDWFDPGSNMIDRWKLSSFYLPESFTHGKSSIHVEIRFISSEFDWNEFSYESHSITADGWAVSDRLDVGDAASELAHHYQITNQTFSGSRTFTFPHPSSNAQQILDQTWLRITFDGESTPSVYAPIGSFFGMGQFGIAGVRALPVGIDQDQNLYVYFPMPFQRSATVELVNQGSGVLSGVKYEIQHRLFTGDFDTIGYFKTFFNPQTPTQPGDDVLMLDTSGSGKFVGVTQSMQGPPSRAFLEGDERIYVDGNQTPVIQGTGTEDFYNGGYYFDHGTYSNPMSGNPLHQVQSIGGSDFDQTVAYRFLLQDAVSFRNHIRVSIEHGPVDDVQADEWTLAYYYQLPSPPGTLPAGAVKTDVLDVGKSASELQHHYSIVGQTWAGQQTATYDGDFNDVAITDDGRADQGSSEFDLTITPANQGVILRRRLDQGVADQRADLYVNGARVGTWYHAGGNSSHRWADDDFFIPSFFTAGLSSIHIRIQFISSSNDWNEFRYEAYSLLPADRTAPGVTRAFFGQTVSPTGAAFSVTFNEAIKDPVNPGAVTLINLSDGTSTFTSTSVTHYAGDTSAFWHFDQPIPDGYYRAVLSAGGVTDASGNSPAGDFSYEAFTSLGTPGNDSYRIWRDGSHLFISVNSTDPKYTMPLASLRDISINTGDADDRIDLDFSNGPVIPPDGLDIDGGAGTDTASLTGPAGGGVFGLSISKSASPTFIIHDETVDPEAFLQTEALDLKNNDLIVGYSGTVGGWDGSAYNGISGLIASGVITSSMASDRRTTLGVASAAAALGISASQTGTFDGQTVYGNATLVKYTYVGDANLDGKVNIDDYGRIDADVGQSGTAFGWYNGDFNLDGKINIDDYGLIDGIIGAQGPVL
jgi:hypothetical protein